MYIYNMFMAWLNSKRTNKATAIYLELPYEREKERENPFKFIKESLCKVFIVRFAHLCCLHHSASFSQCLSGVK